MVATRFLVLLKKTTLTSVSILLLSLCALSFWLILNLKKSFENLGHVNDL